MQIYGLWLSKAGRRRWPSFSCMCALHRFACSQMKKKCRRSLAERMKEKSNQIDVDGTYIVKLCCVEVSEAIFSHRIDSI